MGPMPFAELRDVRHAARLLRRAPLFTVVAVLTLALAVGASTVIFTFVNAVLLRPLSLGQPDRLAMVYPDSGARLSSGYLDQWRRDGHVVADLAGWYDVRMNLTGSGQPREVAVDRVTSNFFQLLGVPPFLGRTFTPDRDLRVVRAEIVLSAGFWQREFGSDPRVLGKAIVLDGTPFTIVGVMPAGFHIRTNELSESRADAWIAFPLIADDKVGMGGTLNVVARLVDGASVSQAQAELALIAERLEAEHPSYSRRWHILAAPLADATVKEVRQTLLVLFGAVGILLLIACANVGTLMIEQGAGATRRNGSEAVAWRHHLAPRAAAARGERDPGGGEWRARRGTGSRRDPAARAGVAGGTGSSTGERDPRRRAGPRVRGDRDGTRCAAVGAGAGHRARHVLLPPRHCAPAPEA